MPDPPSIIVTAKLAKRTLEVVSGSFEGVETLHQWLSADARMQSMAGRYHAEWWDQLVVLLREWGEGREAREQSDAFHRVMGDAEAGMLLANHVRDAYFEPIARRRRMLQHAIVGLLDTGLTLDELARVWRAIRMLSPEDVLVLYGVWLFPGHEHGGLGADPRLEYVERAGADALEACSAIRVRGTAGLGGGGSRATLTRTGGLVLRALRTFIWQEERPSDIEGHEIDGSRSESKARAVLAGYPALLALVAPHKNHAFAKGFVGFEGCGRLKDARPNGKSTLMITTCKPGDGAALKAALGAEESEKRGDPVESIWVERVESWPQLPDREYVTIAGPHDVLRWLAYDLNAGWT